MSTIQQLKNFIRHGRQARDMAAEETASRKHDQQNQQKMAANTETAPVTSHVHPPPSDGKGEKKVDSTNIEKIVAEENERKSRFPKYRGLERWQLIDKMGDGAFSNVHKARDLHGQHGEVAIKVVRKYEMNSQQRANILKEVQIMRTIDHPNIIRLIDFSESKQHYYIVLELAPGGELFHQIVRLTYFSEDLSRHVITQVANALKYLHEERGVVHRDIKPENILFYPIRFVPTKNPRPKQPGDETKEDEGEFITGVGAGGIGQIKIADFGLSKVLWDNQTTTPCGTVGYTAPEIVKDELYSKSVDMWALGCVLYTLLCGFPPFYDESIDVLTRKVARGEYTFLSPWWDDVSKQAKDLISRLLEVDPEERYTIKEFLAHPWICVSGPTPREGKKPSETSRAFDAANLVLDGNNRMDFRSPGAVNLREVFDVGYAVHRQEEEAKRRKQVGAKAGLQTMQGVTEADEEGVITATAPADAIDQTKYKADMTLQLEQSLRNATLSKEEQYRVWDREQVPGDANTKGYGQHSAAVTAAARQQVKERQRQKGEFELNLDGATLLGRRGMKPATRIGAL